MHAVVDFQPGFYSGISGLQLHIPKYLYPPPYENASRLTYYSTLYNSIEFNSSFYKIPQPATVTKWTGNVMDNFRFTFKLWKGITHCKELNFVKDDISRFLKAIDHVQNKKGCLLIQFPPSLGKEHSGQLKNLLSCVREIDRFNWKIAIEFRNKSWYNDAVYNILNYFKAAVVIHDIPKSATPMINQASDFIYLRFHGPTGNYRGTYPADFLSEYATYINEWIAEGKEVYAYFNNTMGEALNNLKSLNSFVVNS